MANNSREIQPAPLGIMLDGTVIVFPLAQM
jgi:hypothetical protein